MKYVLIQKPGFKERFFEHLETFKVQTSEELIDRYNSSVKTGIMGVYAQAIMLVALRHEIKRRFYKIRRKTNSYISDLIK